MHYLGTARNVLKVAAVTGVATCIYLNNLIKEPVAYIPFFYTKKCDSAMILTFCFEIKVNFNYSKK